MTGKESEIEWGELPPDSNAKTLFPAIADDSDSGETDVDGVLQNIEERYRISPKMVRVLVAFTEGASLSEALLEHNVTRQEYFISMVNNPVHKEGMIVAAEIRGMGLMITATELAERLALVETPTPGDRMKVQLMNHIIRLGEIWGSRLFSRDVQKKNKIKNLQSANLASASTGTRSRDEIKGAQPEKTAEENTLQIPDGLQIKSGGKSITEIPAD